MVYLPEISTFLNKSSENFTGYQVSVHILQKVLGFLGKVLPSPNFALTLHYIYLFKVNKIKYLQNKYG